MSASVIDSLGAWIAASLRRKLAATLAVSLTLASLCMLVLLVTTYRDRVLEERSFASTEINRLLQVALENAMLKRDIEGLRQIVEQMGQQEKIASVMIVAPDGEVRFASNAADAGRRYNLARGELCPGCATQRDRFKPQAEFITDKKHGEVLRSINPVRNRDPCAQCHGKTDVNPVNGILVVDYKAAEIKHDTLFAATTLSFAGLSVLLAAIGGIGWMINRFVLAPVAQLNAATSALAQGRLGERVALAGADEMAQLGSSFNAMALRVEGSIRDVEQRERYLQSLIDAMPDGVRVVDAGYTVVKANAAFAAQVGRPPSEIVGAPCYGSSHARDEPCPPTLVTCPLHELRQGKGALTCRHHHVRADGTILPVEVAAAPLELVTASGTKERLIVEVVRDLSSDLRVSQEQRLSEIGFLAAGVAHEIHNPLASIHLGFASLTREIEEGRHANVADYIRVIGEQIERCIAVTERLLRLSASPSDRRELVMLNDVVADTLSLLRAEALKANADMAVDMTPGLRVIASDSEMRMMTLNLAQNALHAMPKGGRLTVVGRAEGGKVMLAFQDTGVGIPSSDLARIFDPFWSRRADGVNGTGLGLPICREIVKSSGGSIGVTSEVGKGTRFTVTLPSADAEVATP